MTASFHPLAAIRYSHRDDPVDALLEAAARDLQARGARVAGYVQRETDAGENCCATMHLENLTSGELHVISQPLGAGAKGCRLDPQALAGLCGLLEADLARGADILVLNRFGKGEAEGHGFRVAIERAMGEGVPVLVAVQDAYLPDWEAFAGDYAAKLSSDPAEIEAWARSAVARTGEMTEETIGETA